MKWWYWLVLELLIIFGVMAWIYFFPDDFEYDFSKGMVGFALIYAIEECRDINRRKKVSENYTIEQNAGENRIEGGVLSLSVAPKELNKHCKWCKGKGCNCGNCPNKDEENSYYLLHKEKFPEPQERSFRPFKNCDELVEYWYDYTGVINCSPKLFMLEIWVKHKEYGTDNLIVAFDNDNESIGGSCVFIQDIWVDMKELFDNFTFLDGSPCGLEE